MKDLKYFLTVEEYKNSNVSSISETSEGYENISFTEEDSNVWIREYEIPKLMTMKYTIDSTENFYNSRVNIDVDMFKYFRINDGEKIYFQEHSDTIFVSKNDFIETSDGSGYYIPKDVHLTDYCDKIIFKCEQELNNPSLLIILSNANDGSFLSSQDYTYYLTKIDDTTYEFDAYNYNLLKERGGYTNNEVNFSFVLMGDNYYNSSWNGISYDDLEYVVDFTISYTTKKVLYLPNECGEYIVKGCLKDDVEVITELCFAGYECGEGGFCSDENAHLISINIPKEIKYISYGAFYQNTYLTSVTFEENTQLIEIGEVAFANCFNLRNIDIPNGVTLIGYSAFERCESLQSIHIPSGITVLYERIFESCVSLSSVTFDENSLLELINRFVFAYCSSLTSITIPSGVTSIDYMAFRSCSNLKKIISLPTISPSISYATFEDVPYNGILYYPQGSDYSSWFSTNSYYLGYYNWVGVELQDSYDFKVNFITNGVRVDSPYSTLTINGVNGVKQDNNSYLFSGLQPVNYNYEFDLLGDGEVIDTVDINMFNKTILVGDNSEVLTCSYSPCVTATIYNGLTYDCAYVDSEYVGQLTSTYTFSNFGEHIIQYSGVTSINNNAFSGCSKLVKVDFNEDIIEIGNKAFYNCIGLYDIVIPNSVTSIGNEAFGGCSSLSSFTFNEDSQLTTIGGSVFSYCYKLNTIIIPKSITTIESNTFQSSSLQEIIIEKNSNLTTIGEGAFKYCQALSSFTVPNTVTSIGKYAFSGCTYLREVIFEEGIQITSIGTDFFNGCNYLKNVTIPNSVTSIGVGAFKGCGSLSSIILPENINNLENYAFADCRSITSCIIPNTVTSIGYGLFSGCTGLNEVIFEEGIQITSIGENLFNNCRGLRNFDIPNSVTSIGNSAFYQCYALSSITIPNGVTSIGSNVFYQCSSLSSITIPNSVTSIGDSAFYNCRALSEITIPDSVTSIGTSAFNGCSSLSEITIGNNVTSIGSSAFSGCTSLQTIIIPDNVESINSKAFYNCSGLTSVTIGIAVTSIGNQAFYNCSSLSEIICKSTEVANIKSDTFYNVKRNGMLYHPYTSDYSSWLSTSSNYLGYYGWSSSYREISNTYNIKVLNNCLFTSTDNITFGNYTFTYDSTIDSYTCDILIDEEIANLDDKGLYINGVLCREFNLNKQKYIILLGDNSSHSNVITCTYTVTSTTSNVKLYSSSLNFDGNSLNKELTYNYKFDSIGDVTIQYYFGDKKSTNFNSCVRLKSIIIPNCIKTIQYDDFNGCSSLTSVMLPNSIETIDYRAFANCTSLSDVAIPNSVTSIGTSAFTNCTSLSEITIPSSVKVIDSYVFKGCSSLTSITIPNGVTSIYGHAFYNCSGLTNVEFPSSITMIVNYAFNYCSSLSEITCLAETAPSISYSSFEKVSKYGILYYPQGSNYSNWLSTSNDLGEYGWVGIELQDSYNFKVNFITNGLKVDSPYNSLIINDIEGIKQDDNSYLFSGLQPTDGYYKFDLIADGEVIDTVDIRHKNKWIIVGDNSTMLTCIYDTCLSTNIYSGNNLTYTDAYVDGEYIGTLSSSYTFSDVSEHIIQYSGVTSIGTSVFRSCYKLSEVTIPNSVTSIGTSAFTFCSSLSEVTIPNSVTSIGTYAFYSCDSLTSITIPNSVTSIDYGAFYYCTSLSEITCLAIIPPTLQTYSFSNISSLGVVYYLGIESYDSWKKYLPSGWDFVIFYTPQECTNLVISAEDVNGRKTSTRISYTATTNGIDIDGNVIPNIVMSGTTTSAPFSQNTDTENEVIRTITFEYLGATASTTITQGVWVNSYYEIDLNNQWQLSTSISNPDSSLYDGVYESFSNKGIHNSAAICTITIDGYENFKLYVRNYTNTESNADFVVVSNLDCTLSLTTTSGTNVKMTTQGKSNSGTAIGNYTLVEFSGIDKGLHTIQVMYKKDYSVNSGTDKGYLLIPKDQ